MRRLLLLIFALLSACGDGRPDGVDQPIVVIGIDSADWTWIDEQIEAGRMPNFARLLDRGVRAELESLRPPQKSPTIWTSIATGKRPSKHGIADFITHDRNLTGSEMRQAATYWEILGALGRSQAVIGWWITFPATPVNGVLVTDYIQYATGEDKMIDASIYPEDAWTTVGPLRIDPGEVSPEELSRFAKIEVAAREGARAEAALREIAWMYAADESYRRIARQLYADARDAGEPFDVFTVYFRGLDLVSHRYWHTFKPGQGGIQAQEWELEMLADLIPAWHAYVDEMVGEILDYVDPRSRILVVSDHGFYGNRRTRQGQARGTGMHDHEGIFVAAGPGFREGVRLEDETFDVQDIAPTLLAMSGLPPAEDMDGEVATAAFDSRWQAWLATLQADRVDSYEGIVPPRDPSAERDPEVEAEALERLRALGYID